VVAVLSVKRLEGFNIPDKSLATNLGDEFRVCRSVPAGVGQIAAAVQVEYIFPDEESRFPGFILYGVTVIETIKVGPGAECKAIALAAHPVPGIRSQCRRLKALVPGLRAEPGLADKHSQRGNCMTSVFLHLRLIFLQAETAAGGRNNLYKSHDQKS